MFLEFLFDISYRLSFKLSKCESFDPRVEYLGHDLTSSGNCPAKYKFNMIRDWTLPIHGTPSLHGSKLILNYYVSYNVGTIGKISLNNLGHHIL